MEVIKRTIFDEVFYEQRYIIESRNERIGYRTL